jgi:hypothetical protein
MKLCTTPFFLEQEMSRARPGDGPILRSKAKTLCSENEPRALGDGSISRSKPKTLCSGNEPRALGRRLDFPFEAKDVVFSACRAGPLSL